MQLWRLASLKYVGQADRPENWAGFCVNSLESKFLILQLTCLCSLRPSSAWTRPTHIIKDNLLYLKQLIVNIIPSTKYLYNNIWTIVFDQTTEHHSQAKLTHKVNHHIQEHIKPSVYILNKRTDKIERRNREIRSYSW